MANPLTVFISYASEDNAIATAFSNVLSHSFGNDVIVYLDQFFMSPGGGLLDTVKKRATEADVMIIVSTGRLRGSHDWGGFELGSFLTAQSAATKARSSLSGRVICLCWSKETAPSTLDGNLHVPLEVPDAVLELSAADYEKSLAINKNDQVLHILAEMYEAINGVQVLSNKQDSDTLMARIKEFRRSIFDVYKQRVREVKKAQRQMIINYEPKELRIPGGQLSSGANYKLLGNAGAIFGLPDNPENPRSWDQFKTSVANEPHSAFWIETIQRLLSTVVKKGVDKLEKHNPVLLSSAGDAFYRPVLTTVSVFNNDREEASIYFIEIDRRNSYGREDTTKLLDGIDAVCRFRFLFLEQDSLFRAINLKGLTTQESIRSFADKLVAELHQLESDLTAAQLVNPSAWAVFVSVKDVEDMMKIWRPLRKELTEECANLLSKGGSAVVLEKILDSIYEKIYTPNTLLLEGMAVGLAKIAKADRRGERQLDEVV